MDIERKRAFLINLAYYVSIAAIIYLTLRYAIYGIMPFLIGFIIAFLLQPLARRISNVTHFNSKFCNIFTLILFYMTIGAFLTFLCYQGFIYAKEFIAHAPLIYQSQIEPALLQIFDSLGQLLSENPQILKIIEELITYLNESLSSIISAISSIGVSMLSSFATSLPGFVVSLFFMIMSSFFFIFDYRKITSFIVRQLPDKQKHILFDIKHYLMGTGFKMIKAYMQIMSITFIELAIGLSIIGVDNAIVIAFLIDIKHYLMGTGFKMIKAYMQIMSITFIELAIGLSIIGVDNAIVIAFLIAIFDIVPVLGTGGIMIPWIIVKFITGSSKLAIGLLIIYLIVTLIRNIIEPKLVGKQIGLHPLLMLLSMFIGGKLFGFLGIFILPFLMIVIINLNEQGIIHLYK